ncbi:cilia- and flagella-associated protein 300 [Lethenteron reissneri]|uniref:cilia- and flagella-associated protein 300 n=1 Tax=Lethenteron reissneri TaxID=7753 RepID=UPI002AB632D2|nr:cilia- and flagella-associated protein 300 [Lethenteron reissneri]
MTESLVKWSMYGRLVIQAFSFDQPFQPHLKDSFVLDFLRDPAVAANLIVVPPRGAWTSLGPVHGVSVRPVRCSQLSVSFFDRLAACGVTRPGGRIVGRRQQQVRRGFLIDDELRKLLLSGVDDDDVDDDDDNDDDEGGSEEEEEVYRPAERDEFLFRVLGHVALGGQLSQHDGDMAPYLLLTRHLYRLMLR